MKKIAYIGHSFHKKTKSTQFFIDILLNNYEIDFFWTLPLNYKSDYQSFNLNKISYDALIFFQIIPTVDELETCLCKNIILIPMFDNDLTINYSQWSKYYKFKFINFSKTLFNKLDFLGFKNNLYLQYAPEVHNLNKNTQSENKKPKIFFWQRSKELDWQLIKNIIDFNQIESIHFHRIESDMKKDNWFQIPDEIDLIDYNITLSSWFEDKNELLNVMNDCDIFIAPRLFEGIGQTFLEAMALGKCVISPDFPTMNEYIDNKNGILFDFSHPQIIDLSKWKELGEEAYKSITYIRKKWEKEKYAIINLIEKPLIDTQKYLYKDYLNQLEILHNKDLSKLIIDDLKIDLVNDEKSKSFEFSKYLNTLLNFISTNINENQSYIIYGTGTGALLISNIINKNNIKYFIDVDENKQNTLFLRKKVYSPNKLLESDEKIIISVFGRAKSIEKFLKNHYNISKDRLIILDF